MTYKDRRTKQALEGSKITSINHQERRTTVEEPNRQVTRTFLSGGEIRHHTEAPLSLALQTPRKAKGPTATVPGD